MQFVVLSRPDIKGVLPKGKDKRSTVEVEQRTAVNSWIILYIQLAALKAFGALRHLGNTPLTLFLIGEDVRCAVPAQNIPIFRLSANL